MAKERKPYTFAKRGVTRQVMIKDAEGKTFWASFNLRYVKVENSWVEWIYTALNIKLDASEVFKYLKTVPGNGIYIDAIDWQVRFNVSDKCAVEVDDVTGFWRPQATVTSKSGGKTLSSTFDPTSREHFKAMTVAFEAFVAKNTELHRKLAPFMNATAVKAMNDVSALMKESRANASNEQLRKAQRRQNMAYDAAHKIMEDIFKEATGNTTWYQFRASGAGEEPNITVYTLKGANERRNSLFIPPFPGASYTDSTGKRSVHLGGVTSLLLTFGTNPYPFAVLMTGDFESVGSLTVSRDLKFWAVAKISGQYIVQEMRIDYKLPEEKMEMGCILAIASVMKEKP